MHLFQIIKAKWWGRSQLSHKLEKFLKKTYGKKFAKHSRFRILSWRWRKCLRKLFNCKKQPKPFEKQSIDSTAWFAYVILNFCIPPEFTLKSMNVHLMFICSHILSIFATFYFWCCYFNLTSHFEMLSHLYKFLMV